MLIKVKDDLERIYTPIIFMPLFVIEHVAASGSNAS